MFSQFDIDCQDNIVSYLCYIDLLNVKLISKNDYQLIKLNFRELFIKRLLQHEVLPNYDSAQQFCDKLKETNAIISGSFVLDVLYGTDYHNDIDCYDNSYLNDNSIVDGFNNTDYLNVLKFTQYLYEVDFDCVNSIGGQYVKIRSFMHSSQTPKVRVEDEKWRRSPYVMANVDDEKLKQHRHRLQIIPIAMKKGTISHFIRATFDLEICQNYFDGKHVYLKNIDKLTKKYDFIAPNTKFILSYYVSDIDNSENNTVKRMKKYQERGFNIIKHPLYDKMKEDIENIVANARNYERYYNVFQHVANGEIDLSKY